MVRDGRFSDIPILLSLLEEAREIGKYKKYDMDMEAAKQILMGAMQRTQVRGEGGTCVHVWDDDGVQGFIIGVTERVYHIAKQFMASDLFFYVAKEYNDPLAFRMLLKSFEEWAWSNPRVKQINLGATDAVGDPRRLLVIYKRFGYTSSGSMVEKCRPEAAK